MKVNHNKLDKVLFYFDSMPDAIQKCKPIQEALNMDKQTLDSVLTKLEADGFFGNVCRIEEEDGYFAVYFNEKGRSFAATTSYTKEYWKDWPKRNWLWVILITAVIGYVLKQIFG